MGKRDQSHARLNPLTGEWLLVSPHRLERPWGGQVDDPDPPSSDEYDADCYLCPGNARANDNDNPDYRGSFVFDNDFPALTSASDAQASDDHLFQVRPESGVCRVICYTEKHNKRLATMTEAEVGAALAAMIAEFDALDQREDVGYVQVFENRGSMMGCSNSHPHAQVWATSNVPTEPAKELAAQARYLAEHGNPLLLDYVEAECRDGSRVVHEGRHFAGVVPYWATWPYETLLLPRRAVASPVDLTDEEVSDLARTLLAVLMSYEKLFACSVPYSMGLHARPSDGSEHPEWQFHIHIYMPLLRSASVRKHMVGFEMLGMPQRDITPEAAAETLRNALGNNKE